MKQSQWHADPSKSFYVLNESGHVICNADTLAHAQLIAAAPDMLAALRNIIRVPVGGNDSTAPKDCAKMVRIARVALKDYIEE